MRETYIDPDTGVRIATAPSEYPVHWIHGVNAPIEWCGEKVRGQGHAGRLLDQICAEADQEGVVLGLTVAASVGQTGLSESELIAWYVRCGFLDDGTGNRTMLRFPRARTAR